MGLNISVVNRDREDHPDWDFCRVEGDRDLADKIGNWPSENWGCAYDVDLHHRPPDGCNLPTSRGRKLLSILKDPHWFVRVSY